MKALIPIFITLVVVYGFSHLVGFYDRTAKPQSESAQSQEWQAVPQSAAVADNSAATGASLPGLPAYLGTSLTQAQQAGVEAFGNWIKTWQKQIQDPCLAWIGLDYVILLNLEDYRGARERFHLVKASVGPDNVVFDLIAKLHAAYAQ